MQNRPRAEGPAAYLTMETTTEGGLIGTELTRQFDAQPVSRVGAINPGIRR